ncbi:MAG: nucleoside hydrolase, partial [Elainellaceae cyanobacterium]
MTSRPIIIDCDPGVDDAIALLLAFASPELEILGITTVAGNVPLSLTQTNARKICELATRPNIPVYAGCPRPIVRSLTTAEDVHGHTGLDGTHLPEPQIPLQAQHAVPFLIETLLSAETPITLVALGPLTNLAIALIQEPRIIPNIQGIALMGGAIAQGNITSSAEFNMYVDPHAAHIVFASGIDITMIGLDITHQVLTTPDRLDAIRAISTPVSTVAADLLAHYGAYDMKQYGFAGGPLHDPNVIAYLIQPDL